MPIIKSKNGALVSDAPRIIIEVFATPHCKRCHGAIQLVERLINELANNALHWREINVIEEIDYAVQLGVIATPAIAIEGKLVFTSLPSKQKLKSLVQQTIQNNVKDN